VNGWKMFLNSKDDFIQVAFGIGKEMEVLNENGFILFRELL
jgi:hypothetical protein